MLPTIQQHMANLAHEQRRFINGKRSRHSRPFFTRNVRTLPGASVPGVTRGKGKSHRALGVQQSVSVCPDPDITVWTDRETFVAKLMPPSPQRPRTVHDIAMATIRKDNPARFAVIKALAECYREARRAR